MANFVEQRWYDRGPGCLGLLMPLEWLMKAVVKHRQRQRKVALVDGSVVIVIGNISVGGTGKTPVISALANHFKAAGKTVGIISRGYKGALSNADVVKVKTAHSASDVGDEPKLLAERGFDVWISTDRLAAAKVAATSCDIILSDDGLQHYKLPRTIEICVIDGQRGVGNGHLLPVGPLREPVERLNSVDLILANTRTRNELPPQDVFTVEASQWRDVATNEVVAAPSGKVSAVSGIGNPQRFHDTMRTANIMIKEQFDFPDHHHFIAADFKACTATVVMTEKDAVKARGIAPAGALYLCVDATLSDSFLQNLDKLIENKTP